MNDLVITLLGPDRPGLVEAVAATITANGGNWLESRMAHLAGKFAGILRVEVSPDRVEDLSRALRALETRGLRVLWETSPRDTVASPPRLMELDLMGLDRPGIVREISQLLAAHGVNVEELATDRSSAPMSGEMMFRARARVQVPTGADLSRLRQGLERIESDLLVEIKLVEA